jgi:hypothetical protein
MKGPDLEDPVKITPARPRPALLRGPTSRAWARKPRGCRPLPAARGPWLSSFRAERILDPVMMRLRPPVRPCSRAAFRPAWVRSTMSPRSIWAREAITLKRKRPEEVVVSMASVRLTNPTPRSFSPPAKSQEVLHAVPEPVQLPHHQSVTLAQGVQSLNETGTGGLGASDRVLVEAVAPGCLEGVELPRRDGLQWPVPSLRLRGFRALMVRLRVQERPHGSADRVGARTCGACVAEGG